MKSIHIKNKFSVKQQEQQQNKQRKTDGHEEFDLEKWRRQKVHTHVW